MSTVARRLAQVAGCLLLSLALAAALLLAAIIGDQRRCAHLTHGTATWQTYCGEQR